MIYSALRLLKQELNNYLATTTWPDPVAIGNISQYDASSSTAAANRMEKKVVMTLVNLAEETTLKNKSKVQLRGNSAVYENPPVYLNLFVLLSLNLSDYEQAMIHLSRIVQFFQGKSVFTHLNSPDPAGFFPNGYAFKLIMDLQPVSIDEQSNLWGILGGKQLPSVMYKIRLVEIRRDQVQKMGGVVSNIQLNQTHGGNGQ